MTYSLDNFEYNLDKMPKNEIKRLFEKFCSLNARVNSKMSQLIDNERDMCVALELENLINSSI